MATRHRVRGGKGQFVPKRANRGRTEGSHGGTFIDTLTPGIAIYSEEIRVFVGHEVREWAKEALDYMRANAPWRDRTGDARAGLGFAIDESFSDFSVTLYHSVHYGVWLEIAMSGDYAIIVPTIEALGPDLMRRLGGL